jgi:hypothetical protein
VGAEATIHETLISSQPYPKISPVHVTGTQPSMPAFAETPTSSRDLRRMWHVDEQFHRQDARIRLLEKEIVDARRLALVGIVLAIVGLGVALGAWL